MRITTAAELCKPIGRPGMAIDFPVEVERFDPEDLRHLIGSEVYVQSKEGQFSFTSDGEHHLKVTDISATKIYGTVRGKFKEIAEVDLENLTLLEWNERIVKRIALRRS